jgi:hypothetical protein
MFLRKVMKVVVSLSILSVLAGCTITGEPRMDNVAFEKDGYVVQNKIKDSISVGDVSEFPGTSNFTYSGRLAPNFSDKSFKEVLEKSLENANLKGSGYSLNVKLLDSGDWSDWFYSPFKEQVRVIKIRYTLLDGSNTILNEEIESSVEIDKSLIRPFYIQQRKAAEASYKNNIEQFVEKVNQL